MDKGRAQPNGPFSGPVVLVTGGAGYVGSHACKALHAAGFVPVTYDNLVYGHRWAVRWGPLIVGDITDPSGLDEAFRACRPDAVLHFAAYAYVGESVQAPHKYYRNNVTGTLMLLDAMLRHDVRTLVFSSTCATYGIPQSAPITEDQPQDPINPYGASKLMIERMLRDYDLAYGLRSVALRYFNAAGADPDGEIGESHDPETHLMPLAIQAALGQRRELQVFGNDYTTRDGTAVRDYVHVNDLAEAHVCALRYLEDGGATRALNVGAGTGYTVREVVEAVGRIAGCEVPARTVARRPGDPAELVADPTRANKILNWRPRRSTLEQMVGDAWQWHAGGGIPQEVAVSGVG